MSSSLITSELVETIQESLRIIKKEDRDQLPSDDFLFDTWYNEPNQAGYTVCQVYLNFIVFCQRDRVPLNEDVEIHLTGKRESKTAIGQFDDGKDWRFSIEEFGQTVFKEFNI